MGAINAPELLTKTHRVSHFCCGNSTLDEWLIKRVLKNQLSGASRTFVLTGSDAEVMGYYALATGSVERNMASGNLSRQMPDPIPVVILARLAIDKQYQGKHLGAALLGDAIKRTLLIAEHVGIRGLLIHAISTEAKAFYLQYGFIESPMDPMTLMISVNALKKALK